MCLLQHSAPWPPVLSSLHSNAQVLLGAEPGLLWAETGALRAEIWKSRSGAPEYQYLWPEYWWNILGKKPSIVIWVIFGAFYAHFVFMKHRYEQWQSYPRKTVSARPSHEKKILMLRDHNFSKSRFNIWTFETNTQKIIKETILYEKILYL